ncbi:Helix-turn-helix [Collimonas sp. OK607]|uniref:helix-turn-helix domain-containing protein n=1 Tax=Collimonas sp. OK607 TaxID=1798194 RepID=UPI0008E4673C|nr:helix-turn-helix transcriptional regulator [Collimonas sp. OK607]SFB35822.1 Helix-turn-helix [Collimonas sp. OK607]
MNARTNIQILNGPNGAPAFVVIPYADYIREHEGKGDYIPHEVVSLMVDNDWTPVRAWREHLGLTQSGMAERLGVSQSAYAQQEVSGKLRKTSREKIAAALGIDAELLNL